METDRDQGFRTQCSTPEATRRDGRERETVDAWAVEKQQAC